tara:strand:- start:1878 stop:2921 length:1044 start_codon:yes stop_codon:yes gene_type:complete
MTNTQTIGSRAQVMHGKAQKTSGGLTKKQLKYNKQGKIVSRKASALATKNNRLVKAGYVTKKGKFGSVVRGGDPILIWCKCEYNNPRSKIRGLNWVTWKNGHIMYESGKFNITDETLGSIGLEGTAIVHNKGNRYDLYSMTNNEVKLINSNNSQEMTSPGSFTARLKIKHEDYQSFKRTLINKRIITDLPNNHSNFEGNLLNTPRLHQQQQTKNPKQIKNPQQTLSQLTIAELAAPIIPENQPDPLFKSNNNFLNKDTIDKIQILNKTRKHIELQPLCYINNNTITLYNIDNTPLKLKDIKFFKLLDNPNNKYIRLEGYTIGKPSEKLYIKMSFKTATNKDEFLEKI